MADYVVRAGLSTKRAMVSLDTPYTIMQRIASATPRSPIAVFTPSKDIPLERRANKLDAMFADTILTKGRIISDDNFVGVYHRADLQREDVLGILMDKIEW